MLDKNPDQSSLLGISKAEKVFEKNTLNSVLCSEPFVKARFLSELVNQIDIPIIYLDFDLLYSGYLKAEIISEKANVSLYAPSKENWNDTLKKILLLVSNKKSVVVIDSLNGLYNLLDGKDVGRLVNAYIMLLVFVAKESDSKILFASMARKKEKQWVLSPTGRHVIDTTMTKLYLKKINSGITMDIIGNNESVVDSIKVI